MLYNFLFHLLFWHYMQEALVTEDFENNHEQMRKLGSNVSFGDTIQVNNYAR